MPNKPTPAHDGVSKAAGGQCDNDFGYHCPKCGECKGLAVSATVEVLLVTDGSLTDETDNGDHEFTGMSAARCIPCGWHGHVADLTIIGDHNA